MPFDHVRPNHSALPLIIVSPALRQVRRWRTECNKWYCRMYASCCFFSLSVLNVNAAFAERVPVVHIVGTPPTKQMKEKPLLHHTLGNGHFEAYSKAAENFVVASAILSEPSKAGAKMDKVLVDCVIKVFHCNNFHRSLSSYSSCLVPPRLHHNPNGSGQRGRIRDTASDTP